MALLHATPAVERIAADYIAIRLWAAPAVLLTLALRGALIGLGYSRDLLLLEGSLNGLNLVLNVGFVMGFGWGARGVALGTALAESVGLLGALYLVRVRFRERPDAAGPLLPWRRVWQPAQLRAMIGANADIWLRTSLLVFGFAYFTDRSAGFGDDILAGNHLLLQFTSFSAFFLDGYANVAESLVGEAVGAKDARGFDLAVRRSSELAVLSAILASAMFFALGGTLIDLLTNLPRVRAAARTYLPYASLYVLLSVAAFQLDGIFVGATSTRAMRNAAVGSTSLFLVLGFALGGAFGNRGLWYAMLAFIAARALTLAVHYPGLRRSLVRASESSVA
jgi:MATE family multidrug resistance protein